MLIVCIVLDTNAERVIPRIKKQIREYIIDYRDHQLTFRVVKPNLADPVAGCYQSHLEALTILAERDDNIGLVLEEDVYFTYRFDLGRLLNQYSAEWSLIYLGYNTTGGHRLSDTAVQGNFFCAHAIIFTQAATTLEYVRQYKFKPTQLVHNMDVVYQSIKSVGVYPMVALQLGGYSSIERKTHDLAERLVGFSEVLYSIPPPIEKIYTVINLSKLEPELIYKLRHTPITYVFPTQPLTFILIFHKNRSSIKLDTDTFEQIITTPYVRISEDAWSMHACVYEVLTVFSKVLSGEQLVLL